MIKWLYYEQRTKELFYVDEDTELIVLVGNHDVGFHYDMTNHKIARFNKSYHTQQSMIQLYEQPPSQQVLLSKRRGVHFVLVNSMALENDGCRFCSKAQQDLAKLSTRLNCLKAATANQPLDVQKCNKSDSVNKDYSRPIVFSHFPLYRISDAICPQDVPDSEFSHIGSNPTYRSKFDCISHESTLKLIELIQPRLVFNGHSHYSCVNDVHGMPEHTLSSFSWRNIKTPSFLLVI
jgi:hypothetical protein